ncbi:MAG: hypothetical protein KJ621_20150, partial [Proteobacteria bacterium]|nr:hypothetical protein [Pseudomonadota bacterium]
AGAALLSRLGRRRRPPVSPPPSAPPSARYIRLALAAVLGVFIWVQIGQYLAGPWGGGDSVAIWNLRAKALFYLPAPEWTQAFSGQMPNSHPDYPFGLSLLVAAGARAWGEFNPLVPAVISALFGASVIGLLATGLRLLSGPVWLGLLVALAAPRFVVSTAHQCADVPLAACFVGAAVLALLPLQRPGRGGWFLAGLLVGGAAMIKNEGLVLAGLFVLVSTGWWLSWPELRRRAVVVLPLLVLGAALTLAAAVAFKLTLAPPGDLTMHNSPARMMENLLDPARWGMIAGWVFQEPFVLKHWLGWLLPVFVVAAWKGWRDFLAGGRLIPLVLLIVLAQGAAFIGVYLVTPRSLAWHLATSYHRLLFQLWPVLVLLACLPLKEALGGRIEAGVVDPPPGDHAAISRQGNRVGA